MKTKPRILLVGSHADFATADVYRGYLRGLWRCGVHVYGYPLFHRHKVLARELCMREIHSLAEDRRFDFDYVVFITATSIDPWVPLSVRGPKCIAIITEDPQIIDTSRNMRWFDAVTSNERLNDYTPFYLPVAADDQMQPLPEVDSQRDCDLLFIGSLYPERLEFLESIEPFLRGLELKVRIIGNFPNLDLGISSISDWCEPRRIPLEATLAYMQAAKIVLNFHRTPFGSANQFKIPAGSTNPRTYEAASVGAFMLSDRSRPEVAEIFGDAVPTFDTRDEFCDMVNYYLQEEETRIELGEKARMIFLDAHTYVHRARRLLEILGVHPEEHKVPPPASEQEVERVTEFVQALGGAAAVIETG